MTAASGSMSGSACPRQGLGIPQVHGGVVSHELEVSARYGWVLWISGPRTSHRPQVPLLGAGAQRTSDVGRHAVVAHARHREVRRKINHFLLL